MSNSVKSEDKTEYVVKRTLTPPMDGKTAQTYREDTIITEAISILADRMKKPGRALTCPEETRDFVTLKLAEQEREVFACLFLDNRHRVIKYVELFYGTIDGACVYPREVVKAALKVNAAAMILCHNHPSGSTEPSQADRALTGRLKEALELVSVRVLDHIIVGGVETVSMAELGMV